MRRPRNSAADDAINFFCGVVEFDHFDRRGFLGEHGPNSAE
jgi:hypothetical protein